MSALSETASTEIVLDFKKSNDTPVRTNRSKIKYLINEMKSKRNMLVSLFDAVVYVDVYNRTLALIQWKN